MKIELKPIRPKRISDQVFDQLRELIFRGEYQPGQKIMTERELAEALNVSRNSVREARVYITAFDAPHVRLNFEELSSNISGFNIESATQE